MDARPYDGLADLAAMQQVSRLGRIASPLSAYWHPGELEWWYFYGGDRRPGTAIWDDADGPAGWVLVDDDARSADAAVRPNLRGGPAEEVLMVHVEERLGPGPVTLFAWADDAPRLALLAGRGYVRDGPAYQTFAAELDGPVDVPRLPDGFRLLDALTEEWVAERAECHRRAFDPSVMTPERYAAFRAAPGYDPELDVAVVSDDGRVVAYAMAWADPGSATGQLEPVGTRPHFWRRGLGQVANREALARLRRRGMRLGGVNTWANHEGNIGFYESCGFRRVTTIDRWVHPG